MEAINPRSSDQKHSREIRESIDKPQGPAKRYTYTFSTQPLEIDLKKLLTQVTGRTDIKDLTEVKMKVVTRQAGLHRLADYAPQLRVLILDGSCVSSFRDLGSSLKSLTFLSVVRCNLRHLDGAWGFRGLKQLNASDNFVVDPSPCSGVRKLAILDLSNNDITDLSYFAFLRSCGHLRELNIARNNFEDYTDDVRTLLPQVRLLDGLEIERGEGDVSEERSTEGSEESSEDGSLISLSDDEEIEKLETHCESGDSEADTNFLFQKKSESEHCSMMYDPQCMDETEEPRLFQAITDKITEEEDPPMASLSIERPEAPAFATVAEVSPKPLDAVSEIELKTTIIAADKNVTHDPPSKLASGRVICGNLAVSLRTRNPTKNLFTLPQKSSEFEIEESI